ncbi:MAG: ABC transporter substrate-binding protein [Candidatus Bathyarchaeota archaeon]|nr:ABC transporter substrate-binding protein [Candidatus Bathyarchaeota archaeon]
MNKITIYAVICVVIIAVSAITAVVYYQPFSSPSSPTGTSLQATQQIVDMTGRTVTVPTNITRIIAVYTALRLITYMNASSLVCAVEQIETTEGGRPYNLAHPEYTTLPLIGSLGGDAELIAAQHPDVVFDAYRTAADLDSLQSQLGIPVIGLAVGGLDNPEDRQTFYDSLTLLGKVLHKETRATGVINYVDEIVSDLNTRTSNIADADKPTVYVGGLSWSTAHGITSTSAAYSPFALTNSKNVVTLEMANNSTSVVTIDTEILPNLNPQIIFVDYGGITLIQQDVQNYPEIFNQIDAIKNGHVYGVLCYVWYGVNVDVALADAYYVGSVLYPSQFSDIDPEQKAGEICTFLCGAPAYDQMVSLDGPFGPVPIT